MTAHGPRRRALSARCWQAAGMVVVLGCSSDAAAPNDTSDALQALIDGIVDSDPIGPGAILAVEAEGISFLGAAGDFAIGGEALEPDDLFRIASVTKTFTAAAVFVLVERGELTLDDSIDGRLKRETTDTLVSGGYDPRAITLRHLLDHTAGIFDYTEAEAFYDAIRADPDHVWTRAEQLQVAMDEGSVLNEPGEEFHYGDTHYILAGEILEQATGLGLAASLRTLLRYDELGLVDTFLESLEDPPGDDALERISHPYIGDEDTRHWHPSWDLHGGGGLVSSASDLLRFFQALFAPGRGGIFADPATLEAMMEMPAVGEGAFFGMDGGMGINRFVLDGGGICYAGFGYFSTNLVYCPLERLMFASTQNQAEPEEPDAVLNGVLEIMAE